MKTPTLETARLILRPISMDDAPAIQKYFDNWNIIKFTHAPWPYPENGALENIRSAALPEVESGKRVDWVITLKNQGEAIGRIDYHFYDDKETDRGFWLAQPFQGNGYMTEAVAATQDYMFFDYGLDRFEVKNALGNGASRRIKEKTGGILMRTEDKSCSPHLNEPTQVWKITKASWEAAREKILG